MTFSTASLSAGARYGSTISQVAGFLSALVRTIFRCLPSRSISTVSMSAALPSRPSTRPVGRGRRVFGRPGEDEEHDPDGEDGAKEDRGLSEVHRCPPLCRSVLLLCLLRASRARVRFHVVPSSAHIWRRTTHTLAPRPATRTIARSSGTQRTRFSSAVAGNLNSLYFFDGMSMLSGGRSRSQSTQLPTRSSESRPRCRTNSSATR